MQAPKSSVDDNDWTEVLRIFRPPWKIHDVPDGGVWLEDATGKPIVYIYHRRKDVANWKKPSHEEALVLAKAIARMSKQ
jgi:hypothetical protein